MHDAFVSVDAATDLKAHARRLRRSWELVLAGGEDLGVRALVRRSWVRSEAEGVRADANAPRVAYVSADEIDGAREASRMNACMDVVRSCLGGFAHDAEHFMTVLDADGAVLWQEGQPALLRVAERIDFTVGMDWTESSAGTNAGGTAMALDHAVQIYSAEHFVAAQHPWWCSAAPVHDPLSGAIVGVVGLSGPDRTAHPHSLQLVSAAARMAEQALRFTAELQDERLRRAYSERTTGARTRALALVAADGRVLEARRGTLLPGRLAIDALDRSCTEPIGGSAGWILWDGVGSARKHDASRRRMHLTLLGHEPSLRLDGRLPVRLRRRHAELLAILALHPAGLSTEDLTEALFQPEAARGTTRAEVSRLRALLPGLLTRSPYRIAASVSSDARETELALTRRDTSGALCLYRDRLLAGSRAPRIERWRDELENDLRRAALEGTDGQLWAWVCSPAADEDLAAVERLCARLPPEDPRAPLAALRRLAVAQRAPEPFEAPA